MNPAIIRDASEPEGIYLDRIVSLWQREFVNDEIGADDDFFELGGDSLLALELIGMIEEELGFVVPASSLLAATTPRALSKCLASLADDGRQTAEVTNGDGSHILLPLSQPEAAAGACSETTTRAPMVCFHAIDGGVLFYRDWSLALGFGEREILALESPLLHGEKLEVASVEELASHYLSKIQAAYPQTPLVFCGYSFGALLAYETACQAARQGGTVSALVMIDMFNPAAVRARSTAERLLGVWRQSQSASCLGRAAEVASKVVSLGKSLANHLGKDLLDRLPQASAGRRRGRIARQRHFAMAREYRPQASNARTLLVMTREPWDKFAYDDEWRGWSQCLEGKVSVGYLEGTHLEVFTSDNQQTLTSLTKEFLV